MKEWFFWAVHSWTITFNSWRLQSWFITDQKVSQGPSTTRNVQFAIEIDPSDGARWQRSATVSFGKFARWQGMVGSAQYVRCTAEGPTVRVTSWWVVGGLWCDFERMMVDKFVDVEYLEFVQSIVHCKWSPDEGRCGMCRNQMGKLLKAIVVAYCTYGKSTVHLYHKSKFN